ncbi:hypothetical protein ACVLV4_002618 [Rathayibacter agropyri]
MGRITGEKHASLPEVLGMPKTHVEYRRVSKIAQIGPDACPRPEETNKVLSSRRDPSLGRNAHSNSEPRGAERDESEGAVAPVVVGNISFVQASVYGDIRDCEPDRTAGVHQAYATAIPQMTMSAISGHEPVGGHLSYDVTLVKTSERDTVYVLTDIDDLNLPENLHTDLDGSTLQNPLSNGLSKTDPEGI